MAIVVMPNVVSATFPIPVQNYTSCRTFTLNETTGRSGVYNYVINFTGIRIQANGADARIFNDSCHVVSATNIPLGVINSSTVFAEIAFQPTLKANAENNFSFYYNLSTETVPTYTTDMSVTSTTIDSTYFYAVMTGGAVSDFRYKGTENSNWKYSGWFWDNFYVNGTSYTALSESIGTCALRVNTSVYVEYYCSNGAYSIRKGFFNNSPVARYMVTQPASDNAGTVIHTAYPNQTSGYGGYSYNTSYTSSTGATTLQPARGIYGLFSTNLQEALFFLWNISDQPNSNIEWNAAVVQTGLGARGTNTAGTWLNVPIWLVWTFGTSNAIAIDNATDYHQRYVANYPNVTIFGEQNASVPVPDTTNSLLIYQYANMSNIDNHSIVWKLNIVVFNNDTTTLTNVVVDGANNFSIANYTIASLTAGASNLSQFAYNLTRENITTGGIDRVINLEPAKLVGNATGSSNALTIVNPVDPPSKLGGLANCWTKDSIAKTIWIPIGCTFFWAATYFTS